MESRITNERIADTLIDAIEDAENWILQEIDEHEDELEKIVQDKSKLKKLIGLGVKKSAKAKANESKVRFALDSKVQNRTKK